MHNLLLKLSLDIFHVVKLSLQNHFWPPHLK